MKEVIDRCNWLVKTYNENKCELLTPDVKDDISYLLEEIERLNNIINELEKYLETEKDNHNCSWHYREWIRQVFEKLQKLKESDKE